MIKPGTRRLAHRHVEHRAAARSRCSGFTQGDEVWDATVRVREGRRSRRSTSTSPMSIRANVPHFENIVGGKPTDLGRSDLDECRWRRAVRLRRDSERDRRTRSTSTGPMPTQLCWTAAQEIAHAFGLDHEFAAERPDDVSAGRSAEALPRRRRASAASYDAARCTLRRRDAELVPQDRRAVRSGRADAADGDDHSRPTDGKKVQPGFQIVGRRRTDDVRVEQVELYASTARSSAWPTTLQRPYSRSPRPRISPQGPHTIEVERDRRPGRARQRDGQRRRRSAVHARARAALATTSA